MVLQLRKLVELLLTGVRFRLPQLKELIQTATWFILAKSFYVMDKLLFVTLELANMFLMHLVISVEGLDTFLTSLFTKTTLIVIIHLQLTVEEFSKRDS